MNGSCYTRDMYESIGITVGQFSPRDMPDRPDWTNAPILTSEEIDALLKNIFKEK